MLLSEYIDKLQTMLNDYGDMKCAYFEPSLQEYSKNFYEPCLGYFDEDMNLTSNNEDEKFIIIN